MIVFDSLDNPSVLTELQQGSVGVIPTDTIYGIVARAQDQTATTNLYKLKQRERKPGTILAADVEQLIRLGLDEAVLHKVQHLWPNPISIVIPVAAEVAYLHQGLGDLAVRIPAEERLRRLLQQTGPLVTSSANPPGKEPAATVLEAQQYFGDKVAFYAKGGNLSGRPPSTVVRFVDNTFLTLRPGAVTIDASGNIV